MFGIGKKPRVTPSGRLKYDRYLFPLDVWAIAFGCIVGWGAFVMPGTAFIPLAGPIGTILALAAGAVLMLVIGNNYSYLMKMRPGTGGTYSYAKDAFGRDHAFICSWFLSLSYVTIVFLNATALFVMSRTVVGSFFQFGFHYTFAGYDIYFGEFVLSTLSLAIVALLFIGGKVFLQYLQTTLAVILLVGAMAITVLGMTHLDFSELLSGYDSPEFKPVLGFFTIVLLAPWAYVGFDTASMETVHFKFRMKRVWPIIALSIVCGGLVYIAMNVLSISIVPEEFGSWQEYFNNLGSMKGISSIPTFFAAQSMLGKTGIIFMVVIGSAAIFTGIIGAYRAAARMLTTMAEDHILSKHFLDTPFCILFIMVISIGISFFGRNALVWFVDLTSFGAVVGFGYTSGAAWKKAKKYHNRRTMITGAVGTVVSAIFLIVLLMSKLSTVDTMCTEAFLLLAFWCLLGFVFYWRTIRNSSIEEFTGNTFTSTVLFCLLLYASIMWFIKSILNISDPEQLKSELIPRSIVLMTLIASGLAIMIYIQTKLQKRHYMMWREKIQAEESSKSKSRFLFNMSHDIRTPMNAIIGYTHILLDDKTLSPESRDYIEKMDVSGKHLLTLINDVLEMSRIESGKMELNKEPADLDETMKTSYEMFRQQMESKNISYTMELEGIEQKYYMFDKTRFSRVLLNLLSNAYKFTPKSGRISVFLRSTEQNESSTAFELRVKDNGIGMSKEFAKTVFEAFERERTSTVSRIQGTGLGMAITKSIVEAAGGTIEVETETGKGTEFIIRFRLQKCSEEDIPDKNGENGKTAIDYSSKRLLLVDDVEINRQIASMLLKKIGFNVDTAENGQQAVDKVKESEPGYYDAVLMDIQMPVLNGYEATKQIRSFKDHRKADIPIVAVTANAFGEDVRRAHEAGMNAHVAKPIDPAKLKSVMTDLFS